MHRSEEATLSDCTVCGAQIADENDRAFVLDEDRTLCFECAIEHGGVYDELHDHWDQPPQLAE